MPPATVAPFATTQLVHVSPPSCEIARLTCSPFVHGITTVCRDGIQCIGPGKSGSGAAIAEAGEYVSPPSVDLITTVFRGSCWLYESRTVLSSMNVAHCRSARAPFDVTPPFVSMPAEVSVCPLSAEVDVENPLSAPSPAYAYW